MAGSFVPGIQGLRAVAVFLVLVFHIWPEALSGGYVGVDVFFVLSGFLITNLLLREAETMGDISLRRFYARRVLRLLPAATVVLLAVAICMSLLPSVRWRPLSADLFFSALNVQNWWLAHQSIDYLASDDAASILKHYWSLSVEEQFYLIWPLLVLLCVRFFKRSVASSFLVFGATLAVASLAHSYFFTASHPEMAYFATTTRMWELAAGGLLAASGLTNRHSHRGLRETFLVLGLVLIIGSAFHFDRSTAFPGLIALVPVIGALLVIYGVARSGSGVIERLLSSSPFQYFGGISYSLYLWHWPIIVFYSVQVQRDLTLLDGWVVIAISTAFAHQTKSLVEDKFRSGVGARKGLSAVIVAIIAVVSVMIAALALRNASEAELEAPSVLEAQDYPGAGAVLHGQVAVAGIPFFPSPSAAVLDRSDAYGRCIAADGVTEAKLCEYGDVNSNFHVVVVGDSHAVHWFPAFEVIAERRGWRLTGLSKSACAFGSQAIQTKFGEEAFDCSEWNRNAISWLLQIKPDLVVSAQSIAHTALGTADQEVGAELLSEGLATFWRRLEQRGSRIIAIKDTPWMGRNIPDCLSRPDASIDQCVRPRAQAVDFRADPLVLGIGKMPSVGMIDLNDAVCDAAECKAVVGNVLVWRDSHHFTATFSRSLAPAVDEFVEAFLSSPWVGVKKVEADWSTSSEIVAPVPRSSSGSAGHIEAADEELKLTFEHVVQFDRIGRTVQGSPQRQIFMKVPGRSVEEVVELYRRDMQSAGFLLVAQRPVARGVRIDLDKPGVGLTSALVRLPGEGVEVDASFLYVTQIQAIQAPEL